MSPAVKFVNCCRRFGSVRAVDGVTLDIAQGEFFAMLGPSGSGKTTCLRLIAGFDEPDSGSILLDGEDITHAPPFRRNVNTVFQDYALFPHMTVAENVAYGLRVRGVPRDERRTRAREMLEMVRLAGFGARRPGELSGGQRQRVALARALVNRPSVLLLDEPLGALDLQLRQRMQVELRALQRRLGITFIFVTHDQGEALSMSDRLAVFHRGRIEQIGTPREIYEQPATRFAAEFVGDSNIVERAPGASGEPARAFSLRPEKVTLSTSEPRVEEGATALAGEVADVQYHGASVRYVVALADGRSMTAISASPGARSSAAAPAMGSRVWLSWSARDLHRLRDPSAH